MRHFCAAKRAIWPQAAIRTAHTQRPHADRGKGTPRPIRHHTGAKKEGKLGWAGVARIVDATTTAK
jgi:hypothetical protein